MQWFFSAELTAKHTFDINLQSHEDWDFLISLYTSGVEFEWIDFGSDSVVVHIDQSNQSRNRTATTSLDYLSIYRKWPAKHTAIKQARAEKIKKHGHWHRFYLLVITALILGVINLMEKLRCN